MLLPPYYLSGRRPTAPDVKKVQRMDYVCHNNIRLFKNRRGASFLTNDCYPQSCFAQHHRIVCSITYSHHLLGPKLSDQFGLVDTARQLPLTR